MKKLFVKWVCLFIVMGFASAGYSGVTEDMILVHRQNRTLIPGEWK